MRQPCKFGRKTLAQQKEHALVPFHPRITGDLQIKPSDYEGAWSICCIRASSQCYAWRPRLSEGVA